MPENDEPRTRRTAAFWLTLSFLIPVMYVLSVGPVCWCHHRAGDDERVETALEVVYQPLICLGSRAEWFQSFLDWYADIF